MTEPNETMLTVALDHAWRRFEFPLTRGLQILNHYLLTMAFLTAAFVTALASDLPGVAGYVAIAGAIITPAACYAGYWAAVPLRQLESRLATVANVQSFDAVFGGHDSRRISHLGKTLAALFALATGAAIAAAIFAFAQV